VMHHKVTSAPDAGTALKLAAEATFDLVISDLGLPDQSGFDLMKLLSSRHQLRGICLSGYGMEEDMIKSREAGFLEHLIKPINFQRLESTLAQVVRNNGNGHGKMNGKKK